MAGIIQVNGTRGELTELLSARIDIDLYQAGWKKARNWVSLRFGGMTRMPGTIYMGDQRGPSSYRARWLLFAFNREQTYAIEATRQGFRFWTANGRVEVAGVPYLVSTPYETADLPKIKYRQIGDVMYLACDGHPIMTLTRNSETDWDLEEFVTIGGPFMPVNTTSTTIEPNSTGNLVPDMTSATTPSGTAAASDEDAGRPAWQAFDRSMSTEWVTNDGVTTASLSYDFAGGATEVVVGYVLTAPSIAARAPSSWTFDGYDGSNWVTLDTQSGLIFNIRETRYFAVSNTTAYEAYRIDVTANGGDPENLGLTAMSLAEDPATASAITFTASSTTGINDDTGFQAGDVGRLMSLKGEDGITRIVRITGRSSTTVVTGRIQDSAPFNNTRPLLTWRLGLWGDIPGYPAAVGIHEDRLAFAGYPVDPTGVVASVSADYDNFSVSSPVVDDDAVTVRMSGGQLNAITWLSDGPDLIVGTEGSIRALGRNENSRAFAPGNTRQRTETEIGTTYIEPINIENMLLVVDSYRGRVYEVGYAEEVQGYVGRELSGLNEHLTSKGITSWAYQASPHKIIWITTDEGTLLAATYDRQEKVFGITECDLGPDSFAEAVLVLPGTTPDGDILMLAVRRGSARYVEKLSSFYRAGYTDQEMPIYLHSCGVYDGAPINSVTMPTRFASAASVGVWGDGVDYGDIPVVDGEITLPFGLECSQVVYGVRYTSRLETLRVSSLGNGPQLGQRVNVGSAMLDVFESAGVRAGAPIALYPLRWEADQEVDPFSPVPLRSGSIKLNGDDTWENEGVFAIETNSAFPATIRAVTLFAEGEP